MQRRRRREDWRPLLTRKQNYLLAQISTKRAITPLSFEQIEKFQCLTASTTQGLSTGIHRIHVTRVTCLQTCPKVGQHFLVKKPQKTTMIDFNDHSP